MPQETEINKRLLNRSESALTTLEVAKTVGISKQSIKRWIKVLENEFDYEFEKTDVGDRQFFSHDVALFQELKGYIKNQRWQIRDSIEYIFQSEDKVLQFTLLPHSSAAPQQHPIVNDLKMVMDEFKHSVPTKEDLHFVMIGIEQIKAQMQGLEEQIRQLEQKVTRLDKKKNEKMGTF